MSGGSHLASVQDILKTANASLAQTQSFYLQLQQLQLDPRALGGRPGIPVGSTRRPHPDRSQRMPIESNGHREGTRFSTPQENHEASANAMAVPAATPQPRIQQQRQQRPELIGKLRVSNPRSNNKKESSEQSDSDSPQPRKPLSTSSIASPSSKRPVWSSRGGRKNNSPKRANSAVAKSSDTQPLPYTEWPDRNPPPSFDSRDTNKQDPTTADADHAKTRENASVVHISRSGVVDISSDGGPRVVVAGGKVHISPSRQLGTVNRTTGSSRSTSERRDTSRLSLDALRHNLSSFQSSFQERKSSIYGGIENLITFPTRAVVSSLGASARPRSRQTDTHSHRLSVVTPTKSQPRDFIDESARGSSAEALREAAIDVNAKAISTPPLQQRKPLPNSRETANQRADAPSSDAQGVPSISALDALATASLDFGSPDDGDSSQDDVSFGETMGSSFLDKDMQANRLTPQSTPEWARRTVQEGLQPTGLGPRSVERMRDAAEEYFRPKSFPIDCDPQSLERLFESSQADGEGSTSDHEAQCAMQLSHKEAQSEFTANGGGMYSAQRNAHEDPLSLKSGLTLKDDVEEPWQRLRVLRQRMPPPRPSFCSVREPPKSHDSVRSFNVAPQQPELEFPSLLRERRGTSSAGTPVSTQEVLMDHVEPEVAEPWQRLRIFRQTKSIPRPDFVNPPRLISGQRSQSDSMLAKQHTGGAGEIVAFKRASPRAQRLERDQRIQLRVAFALLDTDSDGLVSLEDMLSTIVKSDPSSNPAIRKFATIVEEDSAMGSRDQLTLRGLLAFATEHQASIRWDAVASNGGLNY